jgi:hypothetical protein
MWSVKRVCVSMCMYVFFLCVFGYVHFNSYSWKTSVFHHYYEFFLLSWFLLNCNSPYRKFISYLERIHYFRVGSLNESVTLNHMIQQLCSFVFIQMTYNDVYTTLHMAIYSNCIISNHWKQIRSPSIGQCMSKLR